MFKVVALPVLCALMASDLSGCSSDSTTTTLRPTAGAQVTTQAALRTTTRSLITTTTTTQPRNTTVNCMNGDYYCQVMSGDSNSYCRYYGPNGGLCQGLNIQCSCNEMPTTTRALQPAALSSEGVPASGPKGSTTGDGSAQLLGRNMD